MTSVKFVILMMVSFSLSLFAKDSFSVNAMLGRGMNMGNMLEAPTEGEWGVRLDSSYFPLIKNKGFTSVRIPIRYSGVGRMDTIAPFTISNTFMARVKWAVDQALKNKLAVVINVHHYNELFDNPDGQRDRFIAIWKQVAPVFKNYSDSLVFEILNEPNSKLTPKKWNVFLNEALDTIRHSNPKRSVIVGTAEWGGVGGLGSLNIPQNDRNLILTIHYYLPFTFTHQKASWVKGSDKWDATWEGTYFDKQSIADDFEYISLYAKEHKRPVYIGEFGANQNADMASRVRWTSYCTRLFEKLGFSWSYWEYCSLFGIYDPDKKVFRDSLVNALISNDTKVLQSKKQEIPHNATMVKNGDFTKGKDFWQLRLVDGVAHDSIINQSVFVKITDPGSTTYAIHLLQSDISLQKGKSYAFGFDAWAAGKRVINAKIQENINYSSYVAYKGVSLTPKKRHFAKVFTMAETRNDCCICFDVGGCDTTGVFIDNVTLCPMDTIK